MISKSKLASKLFPYFLIFVAYVIICYVLTPGFSLFSVPVHHDDYTNLSRTPSWVPLYGPRPLSYFIINYMGTLGYKAYMVIMNVMIIGFISAAYAFLRDILKSKVSVVDILIIMTLICASVHIVEYQRYTGLVTNLTSAFFGMLSLIFFNNYRHKKSLGYFILAFVLFLMSGFCKEDFLLPAIILMFGLSTDYLQRIFQFKNSKKFIAEFTFLAVSFVAFFIYTKMIGNIFVTGTSGHYQTSFHVKDLARSYYFYLLSDKFTAGLVLLSCGVFTLKFLKKLSVGADLFIGLSILSLVAPYSVLPNHLYGFYSLTWQIWLVIYVILSSRQLLESFSLRTHKILYGICMGALLMSIATYGYKQKYYPTQWHIEQGQMHSRIIQFLQDNKEIILQQERIGILRPPEMSPWTKNDAKYLTNLLGKKVTWFIFIPQEDIFYSYSSKDNTDVVVRPMDEHCQFGLKTFIGFTAEKYPEFRNECAP